MKILILFLGFVLVSSVLLSNISFAINYVDSTGYTPSWAKGEGYHSVLLKCTELIGDYSRDGEWCFEWTAYVLDQGIENFPESTKGTSSSSSSNLSERNCEENKLCAFPGEFLKYKNWDTFDDFEEIAVVEFKEKINDDTIRVFIDGFGSKPLTYNLNLKTGIETHDEYKNVNRPFNLLEPIPMKIGQKVSQFIEGSYESTIQAENTANLKEIGLLINVERALMLAGINLGNGDVVALVYDKETGILISNIEKYHLDGKEYISGMALLDTNMFSSTTTIVSKKDSISTLKADVEQISIPEWVRNNAGWWSDDLIGDSDFVSGIQYLITEGIMTIPVTQSGTSTSQEIPAWIKNNAAWWSEGTITDSDFLNGIQWLIKNNILQISQKIVEPNIVEQKIVEKKSVKFTLVDIFPNDPTQSTVEISWDVNYRGNEEIPFEFAFFDERGNLLKNIKYSYFLLDSNEKIIHSNKGSNSEYLGILATEGRDIQRIFIPTQGQYRIDVAVFGQGIVSDPTYAGFGSGFLEIG